MKVNEVIKAWRHEIAWITVGEAIILLRHLGDFEEDKLIIQKGGYRRLRAKYLTDHFRKNEYCVNIRPIYFEGGPVEGKRFKGTFLTMVLDRVLLTAHEKGTDYTLRMVKYAHSFGTASLKRNTTSSPAHSI